MELLKNQLSHKENQDLLPTLSECVRFLEINSDDSSTLPFTMDDTTGGSETELQVAVEGTKENVDLPQVLLNSSYYNNIVQRYESGDTSKKFISRLEKYIENNTENIWENSWVKFPSLKVNLFARQVFFNDLKADKSDKSSPLRSDINKFIVFEKNEEFYKMPISYLIKLALADAISYKTERNETLFNTGKSLLNNFLSDNTSPETFSFNVCNITGKNKYGLELAKETSKRFLLTHLLVSYANKKFGLVERGQKAVVFTSPNTPQRQNKLNEAISDNFYREIFMSPCLSGWNKGEEKHNYMHLCHKVLSRSNLNGIDKLKEAGIIANNLITLPNVSNTCLSNNGIHVSLGSNKITSKLKDKLSPFNRYHEKYMGDLVIKITEHFLPLFAGSYSAAPYRIPFHDFSPEKNLSFLAHEIHHTHLRMMWRRWKKKARNSFLGQPLTPLGPQFIDNILSRVLNLRGDFIKDYRLIDYLVSLLSTKNSTGLDGQLGNVNHLKKDLHNLGIFDEQMSVYMLYKLREFDTMGFSGFEARYYSLFYNYNDDMKNAVNLQMLLNALAFKYISRGEIDHEDIPNDPFHESERRQIFFSTAVGLPTFFIKNNTKNIFLKKILEKTKKTRNSHRYQGYTRVYIKEYQLALISIIETDGRDLIEMLNLQETMADLKNKINCPEENSSWGKILKDVTGKSSINSVFKDSSENFNNRLEKYYRTELKTKHIKEALKFVKEDYTPRKGFNFRNKKNRDVIKDILNENEDPIKFMIKNEEDLLNENISTAGLLKFINLVIFQIYLERKQ